jgi:flagella basal body P-ring formation protein FlgA
MAMEKQMERENGMKDWHWKLAANDTLGRLALGLGACLCSSVLSAETGHQQLENAVAEFVQGFFSAEELGTSDVQDTDRLQRRVEIDISTIDPRLNLSVCEQPLIASMNQTQRPIGRLNVKVDCQGSAPWTKYVPVNIKVYEKVLVTTRPIARGETLVASDLSLAESEVSTLRYSYLKSPDIAIGMEAKRSLPANTTLVQEALVAPTLVNRGDTVVLSAKAGTVEIRQQGVAMQSGELGKRINVRNTNSDQIVQAIVTGLGEARVGF